MVVLFVASNRLLDFSLNDSTKESSTDIPLEIDLADNVKEHEVTSPNDSISKVVFLTDFFILVKLRIIKLVVEAILGHEFLVIAGFNDLPIFKNHDKVTGYDCR